MKNTIGNVLTVTIFGESHGPAVGAVIDGIAPGIKIDKDYIAQKTELRKAKGEISTARTEPDEVEFLSGVFEGYTTGTPLTLVIKNTNTRSGDYKELSRLARPAHADLTAQYKYGGFEDYRGGGHFSGRITAALVAAGAILQKALENKGIFIGTHIKNLAGVKDRDFETLKSDIETLSNMQFAVLDGNVADKMYEKILDAKQNADSVGGILETAVIGMPKGVGDPWFDTVEGELSKIIFSIPAVKGIEFGAGFGFAEMPGSVANDAFYSKDGEIYTKTNNNAGINGGITNGMPIIFRTAVKPTPSIAKEQETVDMKMLTDAKLVIKGRHDPVIVHRARAVVDACTAICLADMLSVKFGTDYLKD